MSSPISVLRRLSTLSGIMGEHQKREGRHVPHTLFPYLADARHARGLRPLVPADMHLLAGPADEQPVDTDIVVGGSVTEEHWRAALTCGPWIVLFALPFPTRTLLRHIRVLRFTTCTSTTSQQPKWRSRSLLAASKHLAELDHRIRQGNWQSESYDASD